VEILQEESRYIITTLSRWSFGRRIATVCSRTSLNTYEILRSGFPQPPIAVLSFNSIICLSKFPHVHGLINLV